MSAVTHAVVTDITPNRCTVQFVGSLDECYEYMGDDSDGNGMQAILECMPGEVPEEGMRAYRLDGKVWGK